MKSKSTYQELEQEIKKLQKELKINSKTEKQRLLDNILYSSTEMSIAATDINLNVIFFNSKAEEIFGYKASEIFGKNLTEIHAMKKVEFKRIEDAIKIVRKTGNYEYFVNQETQTGIKYLKSNVRGIWDKENELVGFVLFTSDITANKKAETDLIKSEKRYKALFKDNYSIMLIINPDNGNILDANQSACNYYGYSYETITQMNITQINILSEKELNKELVDAKEENRNLFFFKHKLSNNKIRDVEVYSGKIEFSKKTVLYSIIHDITERKKIESNLREYKKIVDLTTDHMSLIDTNYIYQTVNNSYLKAHNKKRKEIIGYSIVELLNNDIFENLIKPQIDLCLSGKIIKYVDWFDFAGIGKKFMEVSYVPYFNNNNKISGVLVVSRDITKSKKAEQNLQQQNKELIIAKNKAEESDQLKTEFINNMSHEIRTPMNAILGFSGFLNNSNLTNEKRKHYTSIIQSSGNQLLQIIDDILEISQLGTKQVKISEKEICLNDLFLELFSIFDIKAKENKTPLYLNKGLSDNESVILTDETKLNKILNNLLENALKFTNEGFIEFGYKIKNEEIEIYVKDTGIGIKPESQKIIFDRFSQEEKGLSRKVGGLGLGLSIAKENAELLSGKITLKSEKRKGAIFYVTIPYKPVNHKHKNDNSNTDKTRTTKKQDKYTILIVEDEEVNYLYIDTLLEDFELNLRTLHAKHGKEAVEICKENTEIDFVLMDMKMPIMNGFEATKLIKKFRPNLPIVAQTAYSTRDEKEQAFTAGCDDFISKPISEETLSGIINKYLIASK